MKKIAASRFSGEDEDIVQLAGDHHLPLLTNNNQQVIWYGGRVVLPSILEENCLISQASSNQTHEVGAPSQSFAIPAPAVVYNPTPLRCFLPPTVDFNGIHIPTGEVDTTLRKSDEIKKRESNNLMPDLGRLRHDSFAGVEVDDVDTLLSLRLPGTTDPKKSRMQAKGKDNPTGNMRNLGWLRLRPDFFDGVEDDEVDTSLSLRLPGTTDPRKSRMQEKGKRKAEAGDIQENKASKHRNIGEDDISRPLIPIEEIPTLMKAVESRNGSRTIFLYRRKLVMSDVDKKHNRLLVPRRCGMMNFLRAEEKAVDNVGLKIVGVDGGGNVYDKLVLKQWRSRTVIYSDWRKVVEANEAEVGDVVEIWGFRGVDEKPCLAFNFRKQNAAGASTSGTSGNDVGTSMAYSDKGSVRV